MNPKYLILGGFILVLIGIATFGISLADGFRTVDAIYKVFYLFTALVGAVLMIVGCAIHDN
jgi:hypothetical protein